MFDEFASALQFPNYFGENWDAVADCISDLEWLPVRSGVAVVVRDAGEVLAAAYPAEMTTLVETLTAAAERFADAVDGGEEWDLGPVPFHVVLEAQTDSELERWRRAGATPQTLN